MSRAEGRTGVSGFGGEGPLARELEAETRGRGDRCPSICWKSLCPETQPGSGRGVTLLPLSA